jgi:hypothetical protein
MNWMYEAFSPIRKPSAAPNTIAIRIFNGRPICFFAVVSVMTLIPPIKI